MVVKKLEGLVITVVEAAVVGLDGFFLHSPVVSQARRGGDYIYNI